MQCTDLYGKAIPGKENVFFLFRAKVLFINSDKSPGLVVVMAVLSYIDTIQSTANYIYDIFPFHEMSPDMIQNSVLSGFEIKCLVAFLEMSFNIILLS